MPRKDLLRARRGTAAEWAASTDILYSGEIAHAIDTNEFKVGDGFKTFSQLPAVGAEAAAEALAVAQSTADEVNTGRLSEANLDATIGAVVGAASGAASWGTNTAPFDSRLNAYNLRPENTAKWRAARARAAGGLGQAHVSCFLDSITHGANTATANPKYLNAWPGRLARRLKAELGDGGTGLVGMWDTLIPDGVTGIPPHDDRLKFAGAVTNVAYGTYAKSAKRVTGTDGAVNYIEFTATCDEFWLYTAISGTGQPPRVQIDGGTIQTIGGVATALTPTYLPEAGYYGASGSGTGNGYVVTRIPVTLGLHTIRMMAPSSTGTLSVMNVEGRIAGKGVRVSNLAQSSRSMTDMILDDATNHMLGLSVAVDMPRPDVTLLMLGMNDYQGHKAVATFKTQVATTIDRIRSGAIYQGNSDVILMTCPQPDYAAPIPADGILTPALTSYYAALYELADEKDVPLIDVAQRWKDYAASNTVGFFGDTLHPNSLGSEDIAAAAYNALMGV